MTIFNTVVGNGAAGSVTITQNGSYDVSSYAQAIVDVSGGGSVGPYVVGNNTGNYYNYNITPTVANKDDTVSVQYKGSSQPLPPGMAFAVTDASGNVVVTLKSSGMMTQNETWTFTMPGYSVVIAFVANM